MNVWIIETFVGGEYLPVDFAYSRDNARQAQRDRKNYWKRQGVTIKTRLRRYQQDSFSRG